MNGAAPSRLFLALWPDDGTRVALARCRDAWVWCADAVPQRTEKLHLTLHFLGAVPQARLPELIDGLRVSFSAFTLHLNRAQRWPNGIAVLTPQAVPPALLALHAALRDGLEGLNVATETRHWRPHLTLARHAGDSAAPAQTSPVHWQVRSYALVESNAVTSDYVVLRRYG
jgi:RNA 2',3'-cyclic 3'-phosphodiesterase